LEPRFLEMVHFSRIFNDISEKSQFRNRRTIYLYTMQNIVIGFFFM